MKNVQVINSGVEERLQEVIDAATATKQRTTEGMGQANSGYCSHYEDIIRPVCSILISFTATYQDNPSQNKFTLTMKD